MQKFSKQKFSKKNLASFICINENKKNDYICNICSENIDDDKIILLSCCKKIEHIFCYDCIQDWYLTLKKKINNLHNNYQFITMCPICRKNGGLLPVYKDKIYIKDIHYLFNNEKEENINLNIKEKLITKKKIEKIEKICCGTKLITKEGYCKNIGKPIYNNLCGKHYKNIVNEITETLENTNIQTI